MANALNLSDGMDGLAGDWRWDVPEAVMFYGFLAAAAASGELGAVFVGVTARGVWKPLKWQRPRLVALGPCRGVCIRPKIAARAPLLRVPRVLQERPQGVQGRVPLAGRSSIMRTLIPFMNPCELLL